MKTVGRLRKTMYRGIEKIAMQLDLHAAAYNLVRMKNLGLGVTWEGKTPSDQATSAVYEVDKEQKERKAKVLSNETDSKNELQSSAN